MITTELKPDKILTLDTFIQILEADEMDKKEEILFPYETLISVEMTPNQHVD